MTSIVHEDRAYRRGLVLGLTMAEIAILLIFCLLLALAALLVAKDEEISERDKQIQELTETNALLKKRVEHVLAQNNRAEDFETLYLEQTVKAEALEQQNAALTERVEALEAADDFEEDFETLYLEQTVKAEALEQQNAALTERVEALEVLEDALKASGRSADPETIERLDQDLASLDEAKRGAERAEQLEGVLRDANLPVEPDPLATAIGEAAAAREVLQSAGTGSVDETIKRLRESEVIEQENQVLQERLVRIQEQNDAVGKGTELPSCWIREGTTRPEYIFDVALTSKGLIVRDRKLPHRAAEQARLPIAIDFGRELSHGEFMAQARPLFDWSVRRGCRFFVQAFDLTATNAKKLFKQRTRTLEQRFYRYEVRDEAWE